LNGGESLTLQQIMETMQALQEMVAASRTHPDLTGCVFVEKRRIVESQRGFAQGFAQSGRGT